MDDRYTHRNVFNTIGFEGHEATNLIIRAQLMRALVNYIKSQQLTQAQVAQQIGITQPRISDLMRGKISLFSVDMLVNMLGKVGFDIEVTCENNELLVPIQINLINHNSHRPSNQ